MSLERARRFALALPEVEEQPHFELTSFRIRGRIFATAPAHGAHLNLFVAEEDRERALAVDASASEKLFWGARAVGVTATLAIAEPELVDEFLYLAWRRKAPKRLASSFGYAPSPGVNPSG